MSKKTPSLDTLFAQAGGAFDAQTGGVVPPLQASTTFLRDENNQLIDPNHLYSRDHNDVVRLAENLLATAEHGTAARIFASGMAAVATIMRTVPNGGRIVMQSGIYWGATKFTRDYCQRRAIDLIEVDCSDITQLNVAVAGKFADILWIETPSNPYLKSVDIAACKEIAESIGALLIVDSTAATPVLSQPLDHGADIVMHSATKAINGHSDVLAGVLICKDESTRVWEDVCIDRASAGAVLGPFEAWLLLRGMRTMPLRVERMSETAMAVAEFAMAHSNIEAVLYPGLADDPGHAIARKQMQGGFGSLLSIQVKGGGEAALTTIGKLKLFKRATSLGAVESLVEHRHTVEEAVPENLLRLSVGIEKAQDLIDDLDQALSSNN